MKKITVSERFRQVVRKGRTYEGGKSYDVEDADARWFVTTGHGALAAESLSGRGGRRTRRKK